MSKNLLDFRTHISQELYVDIFSDLAHEHFYMSGWLMLFNDVDRNRLRMKGDVPENDLYVTIELDNDVGDLMETTIDFIRFDKERLM